MASEVGYIHLKVSSVTGCMTGRKWYNVHTLFIVYINDLDEKMTSTVLKFADDTNISSNSQQELQRDLDTAVEWAQTWQMQFNKCKVMHVGHRNERAIYNMGNHAPTRGSGRGKGPGSADPPNTISQQQLCCGGQESEPDGRTHLQNCDTQERTNCCTTVQSTSETTSGVLLTSLVTLSKEGHSKY